MMPPIGLALNTDTGLCMQRGVHRSATTVTGTRCHVAVPVKALFSVLHLCGNGWFTFMLKQTQFCAVGPTQPLPLPQE